MRVDVQPRHRTVTRELLDFVDRRVRFALGRFGTQVRRVRVVLSDTNGPRGGSDNRCLMEAKLWPGGTVVTDVTDPQAESAVARAVDRLERRVHDALDRRKDWKRVWRRGPLPNWVAA